jgi:hypothetical protein
MSEISGLTGKWSKAGVPRKGWTCIDVEDLGEPSAICEMCETQAIRYVHHMQHPSYPDALGCGCVCAGHMEENYEGARQRERALRNASARRRRRLTRDWRISRNRNPFLNADGYNVVVYPAGRGWSFRVSNRLTEKILASRRVLVSMDAAKLRAFDAMILMKERGD